MPKLSTWCNLRCFRISETFVWGSYIGQRTCRSPASGSSAGDQRQVSVFRQLNPISSLLVDSSAAGLSRTGSWSELQLNNLRGLSPWALLFSITGAHESYDDTGVVNMVMAWVQVLPCDCAHSSVCQRGRWHSFSLVLLTISKAMPMRDLGVTR